MSTELDKQEVIRPARDEKGRLLPGNTANPFGRTKGKTMKEFARDFLMSMDNEQKLTFLNSVTKDVVWRMAEGNPHQSTDLTSGGKPIPIFGSVYQNPSNLQNNEVNQENQGDTGGDISQ